MVKTEKSEIIKISAKGILVSVDSLGIKVKDVKEGTIDTILFLDVMALIGKEITIAIQNKEEV